MQSDGYLGHHVLVAVLAPPALELGGREHVSIEEWRRNGLNQLSIS